MKRHLTLIAAIGLLAGSASADFIPDRATLDAILGGNQILEDFESFDIGYGEAVNLDVFFLDSVTIANGQGPGLVEPGAAYYDPSEVKLQWNGDLYYEIPSKTLCSNGNDGEIHILYDTAVYAMGIDLLGYIGYGDSGVFEVYDANNSLIGSATFQHMYGGSEVIFVGWENAGGIGRVVLSHDNWPWSPVIDNHGYGIPAPGALAALGLFGLFGSRRRR